MWKFGQIQLNFLKIWLFFLSHPFQEIDALDPDTPEEHSSEPDNGAPPTQDATTTELPPPAPMDNGKTLLAVQAFESVSVRDCGNW